MKVFVTGVTGFLGSHVAEVLLEAGHDVTGLARNPSTIDPDLRGGKVPAAPPAMSVGVRPRGQLTIVKGALSEQSVLDEIAAECEAVVHVAGLIQAKNEAEYMRVNRDGAEAVFRAVEKRRPPPRRLVLISSQAAGGPAREGRPISGEDPPRPVSAYGRSKLEGERRALARADALPVTVLRPPVIFGPRDRMLARIFRSVARGRAAVWGDGSNAFNAVHAPDVARAVLLALEIEHRSGAVLYTADDRSFTWKTFIETLAGIVGTRVRILRIPPAAFVLVAAVSTTLAHLSGKPPLLSFDKIFELREPAWLCSSRAARDILGWRPATKIEDALAATHAWYRSRGLA